MIQFEIYTKPRPQKQTVWNRNHAYDPSKAYKDSLIWQMRPYAPSDIILGPVGLDITFYMAMPAKISKAKKADCLAGKVVPITRPDIDNLGYVVTNAMRQLFYRDDSQVVDLLLKKRYGEIPKISIKLSTYEEICH
jgi:Holliday junction resolvase RusA-like endonuclease